MFNEGALKWQAKAVEGVKRLVDFFVRSCQTLANDFAFEDASLIDAEELIKVLGKACLALFVDHQQKFDRHQHLQKFVFSLKSLTENQASLKLRGWP